MLSAYSYPILPYTRVSNGIRTIIPVFERSKSLGILERAPNVFGTNPHPVRVFIHYGSMNPHYKLLLWQAVGP